MFSPHLFASSAYEEVRDLRAPGSVRIRRVEHGQAYTSFDAGTVYVEAYDDLSRRLTLSLHRDDASWLTAAAACEASLPDAPLMYRLQRRRTVVANDTTHARSESVTTTLRSLRSGITLLVHDDVTAAAALLESLDREQVVPAPRDVATRPIVFAGGSAAVLLHEAVGHAAEEGMRASLPGWLTVLDRCEKNATDDAGRPAESADLAAAPPRNLRRSTFRDVPIVRMTNVVVDASMQVEAPADYIEVSLVDRGHLDSLTGLVILHVSVAHSVSRSERRRLAPFELRIGRNDLFTRLAGATSLAVERYPGVLCSRYGQLLPVGSHAPALLLGGTQ